TYFFAILTLTTKFQCIIRAKGDPTSQGVSREHSLSYAIEKQRRIVQVSFGKKITDFRLIIEVVDCGALGINDLRSKPNARIAFHLTLLSCKQLIFNYIW